MNAVADKAVDLGLIWSLLSEDAEQALAHVNSLVPAGLVERLCSR